MARAIWTGSVSFGLVNVPVGLYSATEDHTVHFSQFEKDTPDRIRYRRVNERTGAEVDYSEIVKGYDLGGGDYVIVSPEELEEVEPGRSRTIEITEFVEQQEIDPIFYRNTYYLAPQGDGAERPYGLLLQAMQQADRVAVACFVMRAKQYLAAIRPDGDVLALETMYFADEIRDPAKELDGLPKGAKFQKRELDMARSLIESMTVRWKPDQYCDTYRERVMDLIEAKRHGEAVVTEGETGEGAAVYDLMQALERSLDASKRGGGTRKAGGGDEDPGRGDLSELSKDDLYERAQQLGVSGRSRMTRKELEQAVRKAS
jgi:DNA end-binding protein Ku